MDYQSIPDLLLARRDRDGDRPARLVKRDERWSTLSWSEHADNVCMAAASMRELGVSPGDKVGIVANTSYAWEVVDLATALVGGVTVGIYPTSTLEQVEYIRHDADIRTLFVEGSELGNALRGPRVHALDDLAAWIEKGRAILRSSPELIQRMSSELAPDRALTLVYTSGTTGRPRGAVLTHGNILSVLRCVEQAVLASEGTLTVGYLPLAHVLQRTTIYRTLWSGAALAYAPSMDALLPTIAETHPTQLSAVPRVLEKIHARVRGALPEGWRDNAAVRSGVSARLKQLLGGRLECIYCGGAPLSLEVLQFFHDIGIPVYEGYGLTEVSAVATLNTPTAFRLGSVGRAIPGVEVRIAEDGEVLLNSPGNLRGYHGLPEDTREALVDGWFRTGDLGRLDNDGFLFLTGRKKELIVTAGGKNVAPAPIELAITSHPLISQALVHGDRRSYLTALLTITPEAAREFLAAKGVTDADPRHPLIREQVDAHLAVVNARLAPFEQVKRFALLDRELSVDKDELTPTLKIRRAVVEGRYRAELDALYEQRTPAE